MGGRKYSEIRKKPKINRKIPQIKQKRNKNGKSGDCDQFPGQVIFNTCSIIICSSRLCSVSAAL